MRGKWSQTILTVVGDTFSSPCKQDEHIPNKSAAILLMWVAMIHLVFESDNILQEKASNKGSLGCNLWPLDNHIEFDHQQSWEKTPALPAASVSKSKDTKYNAKVRTHQLATALLLSL